MPAPCFQVRLKVFISSLHANIKLDESGWFTVSKHSVLFLYFYKMTQFKFAMD